MILKRRILLAVIILVTIIVPGMKNRLWSQAKEKFLFQDIPVVITASRRVQPLTEAPTTITVITSEDIRYSGATTIPDVLRGVAGVDVMTITARDQEAAVRGFISALSNKLPVLIDGRSVYEDPFGNVYWDTFPVGLQEIERIEVVKSPASSLYGANAFSGIVSIITKSPQQLKGTTLHLTTGTKNTFIGSLIHAGEAAKSKIRYKISAEWDQTDEWEEIAGNEGEKAGESLRVNARVEYSPGRTSKLALSAGRSQIKDRKLFTDESVGTGKLNNTIDYLQLDFQYGSLKFRTFYKQTDADNVWLITGDRQTWNNATYDAELFHSFKVGTTHSLLWGLNYRHDFLEKNVFFPQDRRQDLWAIFIDDEITFRHNLRLTLGGRYDHHPLTGGRFSPRGNIFYSPGEGHVLRFSVAKAFHNPDFTTSFVYVEKSYDNPLSPPLPPITLPFSIIFQGNGNLKPEGITSYEIGYHGHWSRHLKLDLNLFYNRYTESLIPDYVVIYYQDNEVFPGLPGGIIPKALITSYQNGGGARGIGGEVGLDFSFNQEFSGFVNYSYLQITDKQDNPFTPYANEENRVRPEYPKHKLNAGLRMIFKNGISINLLGHWVAQTERFTTDSNLIYRLNTVDDYFIFNARVGYTFWHERAELGLSMFNLFNDNHYEYPTEMNIPIPHSHRIGRRVTVTLRLKF